MRRIVFAVALLGQLVYCSLGMADERETVSAEQKLVTAAYNLDIRAVKELLKKPTSPDGRWGKGIIEFLREAPIDDLPLSAEQWTPLIAVANSPRSETESEWPEQERLRVMIAKLLIGSGAKIDQRLSDESTALSAALHHGFRSLAVHLIESNADVESKNHVPFGKGSRAVYAIHYAADDAKLLTLLISKGANLDARDYLGNTSLHRAVRNGNLKCVYILLEAGASLTVRNSSGATPTTHLLHYYPPQLYENAQEKTAIAQLIRRHAKKLKLKKEED